MANSYAFVLSKNKYPDAYQGKLIGVNQGTRIVYTNTETLTSANILFADSKLTQPIYGDPTAWYGIQLLTDTAVKYAVSVSALGVIDPVANPTTTTTTTTAAPTTTTTTTTVASYSFDAFGGTSQSAACNQSNTMISVYANTPSLNTGVNLYMDAGLTVPYSPVQNGMYLSIYFAADSQVCTMSGPFGNTIQSYIPCSSVTTTTLAPFFGSGVGYSPSNGSTACASPTFNNVSGNGTLFCNSTVFTSNSFYNVAGGSSVWLAYEGNYVNVSLSNDTATVLGPCQPC